MEAYEEAQVGGLPATQEPPQAPVEQQVAPDPPVARQLVQRGQPRPGPGRVGAFVAQQRPDPLGVEHPGHEVVEQRVGAQPRGVGRAGGPRDDERVVLGRGHPGVAQQGQHRTDPPPAQDRRAGAALERA
ncbi:hypothetical protein GCM10020001_085030 [Nonomuraea salmonea]